MRRGSDWCWPPQPIAAGSNASCTTAPSSAWSRSRSSCKRLGGSSTSHPVAAGALIDEIAGEVDEALDALRALAHRIHPPLLEAGGLRAALRTTAAMLGVPTRVQVPPEATLPPELAGVVYFSCTDALEHLGEMAKIAITVRQEEGTVVFEIVAEGSDSAPADADLTPMRDRLEALGGRLTVASERGHSRISGSLPISG